MGAPIELVIFDCDGVLVDSEPISVQIDMLVLERVGMPMSRAEVINRFVGRSPAVMRAAIQQHLGEPLSPVLVQEFERLYENAFEEQLRAVNGIHEALAGISYPTCVASSSEPASLRYKLKLVGLYEQFAGRIFSASEVKRGKPAPDLFVYAAERMGARPEACVVIEDSQYGVQAARAAGMDVFAYASELVDARLLTGERTVLFDDMRALPSMLAAGESQRLALGS
ncbi:MAG TPA: HAD family hydrolase [Solirubrobacteraceae bacterium]